MSPLLRLDTINYGPFYFYADQIAAIAFADQDKGITNVAIRANANLCVDLAVAGDPDEIALLLEKHAGIIIKRVN